MRVLTLSGADRPQKRIDKCLSVGEMAEVLSRVLERAEQSELISFTQEQVREIKLQVFEQREYVDRISLVFAFRILAYFSSKGRQHAVFDELDFLEGIHARTRTKAAKQFKHKPLHPFWHKHYFDAYHIVKNIGAHWGLEHGGNARLDQMIHGVKDEFGMDPNKWGGALCHQFAVEGFWARVRTGKLTGQWIIFAAHEGKNYYLDLASHEESDADLFVRLRDSSQAEFPFLFP